MRHFFLLTVLLLPAVAEGGGLRIVTQSDVEVLWEGVSLGFTDKDGVLVVEQIPPGSYEILLRKEGYKPTRTQVAIGPEERRLVAKLGPLASPKARERPPRATPAAMPEKVEVGKVEAGGEEEAAGPTVMETPAVAVSASETPLPTQPEVEVKSPGPGSERLYLLLLPLLLVPLAVGLGLRFAPKIRLLLPGTTAGPVTEPHRLLPEGELPAAQDATSYLAEKTDRVPRFLEELRQREKALSQDGLGEIIEAEVIEVRKIDDKDGEVWS